MQNIRHYFPGGNTPDGFINFYDQILKKDSIGKIAVIKGGPGTGKSTFMKRIGAKFEANGEMLDYLHCSSDFHSLDGLYLPKYNTAVIDIKNGDYAAAASKMANTKCNYNLALNQLLSKDYTGAKSTLDCITSKTGDDYYLSAIVAARTNSDSDVYSNLKEACSINPSFKIQAAKDMEFKKYRENADFKAAIK